MTQTEKYLEWLKYGRNLSDNTIKSIKNDFEQFEGDLETATRSDVEMFVIKQNKQGLSSATVARRVASYKGFFEWQIQNDLRTGKNPAEWKVAPKIKNISHKPITQEELEELYTKAPTKDLKAAIALMGYAGLRIGEVTNVGIKNMVFKDENGEYAIHLRDTKGGKERKVTLGLLPEPEIVKNIAQNGGFKGQRGNLSENGLWRRIKKYFNKIGKGNITPHDLRATFGTMLIENDVNVAVVRDMLGHTTLEGNEITSRYVGVTSVEQQAKVLKGAFE